MPGPRIAGACAGHFCRFALSGFGREVKVSGIVHMRVQVVDSHTGGEPTRLVIAGAPDLGHGSMRERLTLFRQAHDRFRAAVVNEPRGNDAIVGALLCQPSDASCQTGVIFFNNVGYLGMCGHGTIGLVATLAHLGRLQPGRVNIETPVGNVSAESHGGGFVTVRNVPAYRSAKDVTVRVDGHGPVTGDVAWGGNWFFLTKGESPIELSLRNLEELTSLTWRIRQALVRNGITGKDNGEIDHIELFLNRMMHLRTAEISFSVLAKATIARLAAPAPARSSLVCRRTAF